MPKQWTGKTNPSKLTFQQWTRKTSPSKLTFQQWKHQVDAAIVKKVGMSADDLPDWPYRDAYNRGHSPASAASAAIRSAKEG